MHNLYINLLFLVLTFGQQPLLKVLSALKDHISRHKRFGAYGHCLLTYVIDAVSQAAPLRRNRAETKAVAGGKIGVANK